MPERGSHRGCRVCRVFVEWAVADSNRGLPACKTSPGWSGKGVEGPESLALAGTFRASAHRVPARDSAVIGAVGRCVGADFAVMEDDSVLCAECVHEAMSSAGPVGGGSIVHAWIDAGPGVCCGWCGDGDDGFGGWAA
jgi:hypothetical protein